MKKIFVSVGLAAGAVGLTSAYAQGLEVASPKLWNVSATLRGFYDDNYTVGSDRSGSFGWNLSSQLSANLDLAQTDFGVRYTFGMYYYVKRADQGVTPLDYTHQADVWLDHAFSESLKLNLNDSLVIAQDPQLLNGGAIYRVEGNNIVNNFNAKLNKEWTRQFSTSTYYNNRYVNYSADSVVNTFGANPSLSGLLDRIEQRVGTDLQWEFTPQTMGFVGYAYSWVRYTGNEQIAPALANPPFTKFVSADRDYRAHYAYVGVNHVFSANLSANIKGGATFVDMYADPLNPSQSVAPYADMSIVYTYALGSYAQLGYQQDINATSLASRGNTADLTQYQETSVFYFDITHRFSPRLSGTLITQYVLSHFKQGGYSGQPENTANVGVNFNYLINRHFSAEAGYNFDEMFSTVPGRSNTRNRVYLGVSANY